ncbi:enoyl-CoA hydratase/isomerase family protein [Amycolatopsis sp. K13G38]|uniref:Enoyl-CoA hydratase/isomerase family protein n=1 Tax=Amycolatopsis acididurans TaxID=2724524 RepID=A0ABX1IZF2_9PSEU|nr:enoyl-CoA hydratase/isomerase family protein [Amycolatopsis acididurans]NKQ51500.1 enoyl-CoA hydratase/isomerase family protein [Amycolatopsis acididurans]
MYDMPDEIEVTADGPLRIVTLNRPGALNAVNDALHRGLARLWPRLSEDREVRAVVLTGAGKTFSAGGDFTYLGELRRDPVLREQSIADGRDIVLGMARCRVPVVAAVNGPAVGLGCSLVALSDVVYIAETAHLADPHVQVGLVAADGGPLTWPLHTSLHLAKEYAFTGARIPAERAREMGLANHVVADPVAEALACAKRIAGLPRQAVESTKRILNLRLEQAVLSTLDYATTAEYQSFGTEDFRATLEKLTGGK